jgi:hypothetical protein
MTTTDCHDNANLASLIAKLDAFADAGIDPAFDSGMEELEHQFADLRLTFDND